MSTTYRTETGDTFATIARRVYGSEQAAGFLASANPGVLEPLAAGLELATPPQADAPTDRVTGAPSTNPDEVAIRIGGQRYRFWDSVTIRRQLDAPDAVTLTGPLNPESATFRETFRPFTFRPVEVTVGGAPQFTGNVVYVDPQITPQSKTVSVSCYASPGVLNDCTPPASVFPVEFDNAALPTIARKLVSPFGIPVIFEDSPGAPFERVECAPGGRIWDFLADLAKQRGLVMGSTPAGALRFLKSQDAGTPVARLQQGQSPLIGVRPTFNPQDYYSHITGLEPAIIGLAGSQYTVRNPRLAGILRPFTYAVPDTQDADARAAVQARAGRMFGNMAAYTAEVVGWRDAAGDLWAPNTTVAVTAPDAMIYREYAFLVRGVTFYATGDARTAELELAVPGAFSGQIPEVLPWEE